MRSIARVFRTEPALVMGFAHAALTVAVVFGLKLQLDQIVAVLSLAAAGESLIVRSQVTPTVNVPGGTTP